MSENFTHHDYIKNKKFLEEYNLYQKKYEKNIRESDKVLTNFIYNYVKKMDFKYVPTLLDIGCSTGNLLLHLKQLLPGIDMTGGDLALSSIKEAQNNPKLSGIAFKEMDVFNLPNNKYDIIIANAVGVYFKWPDYQYLLESVYQSLKQGGVYFAFEWLHSFDHQDLIVLETTVSHPEGIRICFRPIKKVSYYLNKVGYLKPDFIPFEIPFDMEETPHDGEVVTYTRKLFDGKRLMFRGALAQPWCHMIAYKGYA
jgi:SAM-dependent methyltransferase